MDADLGLIWELFRYAILAALVAGLVCPLTGCFLLVRRTGFYGVTLPQFAAAGVVFGFVLLPWWIAHVGLGGLDLATALDSPHLTKNYLLAWAALFTLAGLFVLVAFGRDQATETGRVAAAFAIASAVTILLSLASPIGTEFVGNMLRGEILVVDLHGFETIAVVYGLVLLAVVVYHRDLVLVSYDPDTARILRKRVRTLEAFLQVLIGLTVSVGVLIVGPITLFGLLVVPPLAARPLARSMVAYFVLASAAGVLAALGGIVVSFAWDWPLGPSVVLVAALTLVPAALAKRRRPGG